MGGGDVVAFAEFRPVWFGGGGGVVCEVGILDLEERLEFGVGEELVINVVGEAGDVSINEWAAVGELAAEGVIVDYAHLMALAALDACGDVENGSGFVWGNAGAEGRGGADGEGPAV